MGPAAADVLGLGALERPEGALDAAASDVGRDPGVASPGVALADLRHHVAWDADRALAAGTARPGSWHRRVNSSCSRLSASVFFSAYLRHHLALCGREDPLFVDDAVARLHRVANGLPRALNNAATAALIAAAAENKDLVDDGRRRAHAGLSMQSTTRAGTAMCSEPRRLVLIERCRRVCRQRGRQHRGHSPVGQSGAWVGGLHASRDQGPPS